MKIEKPAAADRQAYYAQAATWAQDVHGALRASRRLAWIIAGVAVGVAALEAAALAALAPLKTVVPYTILVDRQTGYIETAHALKAGDLSQDAAVTQAFLAQYVLARETFDAHDLQANYRKVTAWSQGPARSQYIHAMQPQNPQSPTALYSRTTVVQTTLKSVSLIASNSALVRFETERRDGDLAGERRAYAAVVGFRYTGAPMRNEDRLLNPLGFQVTAYRRDSETVGAPTPGVVQPAMTGTAP
ncbi:VirB8/TrbF family protein [Phenylobacterium sp. LjRoot225]|uniref:virB8 family protein n=1 Tax=Phenylobacterium sp. LjRoot225 TaxID=3342285 RepID=UPI003ED0AAC7